MSTTALPDLQTLRANAAGGAPNAQFQLARMLLATDVDAAAEAFDLYRRAAERNHLAAQVEYARMQLYGVACDADPLAAMTGLERAERGGAAGAAALLANIALGGIVMDRDFLRMGQRLLLAAKGGDVSAMRALAMYFGGDTDNPAAMRQSRTLLEQAARAGDPISASLLLERVRHGEMTAGGELAAWQALVAQAGMPAIPAVPGPVPVDGPSRPLQLNLEPSLQAPMPQVLSQSPRVATLEGLLTPEECRYVMLMGAPWLKRARVVDPRTGEWLEHPVRTAFDATFNDMIEDFPLRLLQLRMAAAIGIDFTHAEQMVLLRYLPGQEYRPHRDYLPPQTLAGDRPQAGQRATTLCTYLCDVESGGGTAFPEANRVVEPRVGRAVAFRNTDDAGNPDPASLHAGAPVLAGEKWLATLWLRERRYRTF
ncbi:2OG-Fe(II) oxygenase [Aerolutibacter ruishenii]|uniref:2-oxoglutarate-Fe(II)-dependent oxygenase superfamily protein n=1 Tax=Aerolutibacter ruishenii TaxID=686800 RepID=A0A562LWG7_9GAMM|nr:2OG-Fe(II) oxygenase [Lysobacter ruishenii]TWI11974.1 2-oxoglutarate-Fe(II)-dependent oxygenase superfamily protein [Lysobacter ruishenii]